MASSSSSLFRICLRSTYKATPRLARNYAESSTKSGSELLVGDLFELDNLPAPSGPPTAGADGYPVRGPMPPSPFRGGAKRDILAKKPRYSLHCHTTNNNTITTFTAPTGNPIAWFSSGSCGFKKGNRGSYEAGYQCAVRMFDRIAKEGPMELDLYFKGFGQGRDALQKALLTSEGDTIRPFVTSITDRTPIKIGGTRAKKTRRL